MPNVLARDWGYHIATNRRTAKSGRRFSVLNQNKKSAGSIRISLSTGVFILIMAIVTMGVIYLYQVNHIATQGYDIKKIENNIQEMKKQGQMLKIREVELKSMYNIEKNMQDLDLVNSPNVSYVEMDGPMAMK